MSPGAVIVTGSASGLGKEMVNRLAKAGHRVVGIDRRGAPTSSDQPQHQQHDSTGRFHVVCADLTREAEVIGAVEESMCHLDGACDSLINCAGSYGPPQKIYDLTAAQWNAVLASNLTATFLMIREVSRVMIRPTEPRPRSIVNISSNAARSTATALGAEYTAAKAGILGLTRHAARDLAEFDIRVNAVAPGPIQGQRLSSLSSLEDLEAVRDATPMGRLASPGAVADAVQFLIGDESLHITGATLDVNGGIIMV